MSLVTEWVRFGEEGRYRGYLARPLKAQGPLPSILVLQEIWGVDAHIQDVTRRFAQAGYAAFAPALFSDAKSEAGELAQETIDEAKSFLSSIPPQHWRDEEQRAAALELLPADRRQIVGGAIARLFHMGAHASELVSRAHEAAEWLRAECPHTAGQPAAAVGFCMGGAVSAGLAAADKLLAGAVIFYGNPPSSEAIAAIGCPLLGFYGELDKRITDQVPGFAQALADAGKSFEYKVYSGAQHAFFNDSRPAYDAEASRDAFARALDFLKQRLVPQH